MKIVFLLFFLIIPLIVLAQPKPPERKQNFTMTWTPSVVTEEKDAQGNVVKTNKPEGYKAYRGKPGDFTLIAEIPGADANKFQTMVYSGVEGSDACFGLNAFNGTHPVGDPNRVIQESSPPATACSTFPVTPVTALPVNHIGNVSVLPQYAVVEIPVKKPVNATKSFLVLDAFDADFIDESELFVNGHGPVATFPSASGTNNNIVAKVEIEIPLEQWLEGQNQLRFVHTSSGGYRIDTATVRFETQDPDPPLPPNTLQINLAYQALVIVSRRATDTASVIGVLVNKDAVLSPEGIEFIYPAGMTLNVSRRADNTSSAIAVLVNKSMAVIVNGVTRE